MKTTITRICIAGIFLYAGLMTWAVLTVLVGPKFTVLYGVIGFIAACQYRHVDGWILRKARKGGNHG